MGSGAINTEPPDGIRSWCASVGDTEPSLSGATQPAQPCLGPSAVECGPQSWRGGCLRLPGSNLPFSGRPALTTLLNLASSQPRPPVTLLPGLDSTLSYLPCFPGISRGAWLREDPQETLVEGMNERMNAGLHWQMPAQVSLPLSRPPHAPLWSGDRPSYVTQGM